jgi:hypothetical protein
VYDTLKNIHAAWLLTPRDDLGIVCPREVMLERHNHLKRDLQDRREQWSQLGECPPGLEKSSFAFRYGGFGTHELVMYYELVRELLWSTWNHLEKLSRSQNVSHRPESLMPGDFLITEVPRLERDRDEWHDTPDPECHMRTPRSIIHRERRRLPEVVSGEEAMIDPDCPCCQMMCDTPGPIFWHLDGSEMDDDFAFDFHHSTREEWEEERRRWEESWKRIDDEREERRRLGVTDCSAGEPGDDSLWTSSFSVGAAELPLGGRVFGIGCHLAELIAVLRDDMDREEAPASVQQFINQLNRNFGNLRELLKAGPSMVETLFDPVIGCFVETLAEVSAVRLDLAPKCEALAHKVKNLLNDSPPTSAGGSSVSEIPF